MSDLPPSPENSEKKHSLLSDILKVSIEKNASSITDGVPHPVTQESPIKPPREPISMATFLKLIGSLLFVSIIFFGSFLAYIAFNPSQAIFFITTFNIDAGDIQSLLKKLINGSFGFVMMIVSILWIISLFRAFWVPKELKRKRLLSWLTASAVGIVLFLILAFWAYIFNVVGATDYSNPSGTILIYDHNLYTNDEYRENSRIYNTSNLIGPIDIFFDIRGNAELVAKNNLYNIESYELNFDGARCNNGSSTIGGANPENEQSIVCSFDEIKTYNILGSYNVRSRDGTSKSVPIVLPSIEVRGLVDIKSQPNNRGQKIVTLDANSLKKLGPTRWIYSNGNEVGEPSITETVTSIPQGICLKVFEKTSCDRIFLLEDKNSRVIEGAINSIQDMTDKRVFRFSLSGVTINPNEIVSIDWILDGQNLICKKGDEVCNYTFTTYGRHTIKSVVEIANGEKYSFEGEVIVNEPLIVIRHVKVVNDQGVLLNEDNTYDNASRAYILKNVIIPPESLTFDARDIISGNPGYTLDDVLWKIENGRTTEERKGEKIVIEFNQPLRYKIDAIYTFKKSVPGEKDLKEVLQESIIIDIERRSLMPRMEITNTSDYVPSLVTIDASQSESEDGEIKKFIFDFGEGKAPASGDAVQQYEYTTSGDKTITLTIISETGEKTSLKKTIVLKDQVKTLDFIPSILPGVTGSEVDFEPVRTTGQINEYIWNFGDNTPVVRGYEVSHIYSSSGMYNITLTILYSDGTQKNVKKSYEVIDTP